MLERNIYDIKYFITREVTGTLRPISSNVSILLKNLAIVNHVHVDASTIPRHKFEIIELGQVFNIASSYAADEILIHAIDKSNL